MTTPTIPGYRLIHARPDPGPGDCYEAVTVTDRNPAAVRIRVVTDAHPTVEFDRLVRELEISARLGGDSQIGTADGALWVVYPDHGPTLADIMPDAATALAAHACAALAAGDLHALGATHRAISPATITWDGKTGRLADFGRTHWPRASSHTTGIGPVGAVSCMAPELLRGQRAAPASDVWSLAASLHLSLTGVSVHGELPTGLVAALHTAAGRDPRVHTAVPGPLRLLLSRELSADPTRRSPNGTRLAELLDTQRTER